jgi:2-polyprenyl-6-methoxyphenol hydroxylase-like FAD-dependent oxidoreductase
LSVINFGSRPISDIHQLPIEVVQTTATSGEGANLAMFDAAELGHALCDHPGDVEAALSAYEQPLHLRSATVARLTAENHRRFFGDDAPQSVVELFSKQ